MIWRWFMVQDPEPLDVASHDVEGPTLATWDIVRRGLRTKQWWLFLVTRTKVLPQSRVLEIQRASGSGAHRAKTSNRSQRNVTSWDVRRRVLFGEDRYEENRSNYRSRCSFFQIILCKPEVLLSTGHCWWTWRCRRSWCTCVIGTMKKVYAMETYYWLWWPKENKLNGVTVVHFVSLGRGWEICHAAGRKKASSQWSWIQRARPWFIEAACATDLNISEPQMVTQQTLATLSISLRNVDTRCARNLWICSRWPILLVRAGASEAEVDVVVSRWKEREYKLQIVFIYRYNISYNWALKADNNEETLATRLIRTWRKAAQEFMDYMMII